METKIIINDAKTGKSYQKAIDSILLVGKKIGDKLTGEKFGLNDYEFEITGGSDTSGIQMRPDVAGQARKKILIASGVGLKKRRAKGSGPRKKISGSKGKGIRIKKLVAGNTISSSIAQVNLKIINYSNKDIADLLVTKKEAEA